MSGHSKFANIKHKKEKNDAAKGKIFTVIGREIAVAVKEGGPDPANNSKLRDVIAKAKSNNMPNDTIERGIKKAAGDANSVNYVQNTYEGYGPNGIAIIVETLTDNKNRTAANVRSAFSKGRGNIGTSGCVSFMFQKKGQIIVSKEEYETDPDEFMMIALDAGAEDFNEEEDSFEVLTTPEDFSAVREALEKEEIPKLQEKARKSGNPQDAQELNDFVALCNRFEKKIHDLELTKVISLQMAPQIRLIQNNDSLMSEKIQSTLINTIPLWKNQMVLSLGVAHATEAAKVQREVTDMTNELLRKNSEILKTSTMETAKESERGIVDIETLKATNESLISTLDEILNIQTEGRQKRREAEIELRNIENQLKEKLIDFKS